MYIIIIIGIADVDRWVWLVGGRWNRVSMTPIEHGTDIDES
jgi:hypothetical protein